MIVEYYHIASQVLAAAPIRTDQLSWSELHLRFFEAMQGFHGEQSVWFKTTKGSKCLVQGHFHMQSGGRGP